MTKTWEQTKEAAIEAGITSERALQALRKATAPARHAARVVAALSAATGVGEARQAARALLQLELEVSRLQKKPTARSEWARRLGSGRRKAADGAVWDAAIADAIAQAGGGVELDVASVEDLAVRIPECRDTAITWLMEAAERSARGWAAGVRHSEEDKAELIAAGEAADRIDALEERQRLILSLALGAIGRDCDVPNPRPLLAVDLPASIRSDLYEVLAPVSTPEVIGLRRRLRSCGRMSAPAVVVPDDWNRLVCLCGKGEILVRDREPLTDDAILSRPESSERTRALAGEMYARAQIAAAIREGKVG